MMQNIGYFLTVRTIDGGYLHSKQRFDALDAALREAGRYLRNPPFPHVMLGYFSMRDGALTSLCINRATGGNYMADEIARIEIFSARGFLEHETDQMMPDA